MKLREVLNVPEDTVLEGFYAAYDEYGIRWLRANDDKLVAWHNGKELKFYDPQEVDIYVINAENYEHVSNEDVSLVLNLAWGSDTFSVELGEAIDITLAAYDNLMGVEVE